MENPQDRESRFAWSRDEFGLNAHDVLDYLCSPALNQPEVAPHEHDFNVLYDLRNLEEWAFTLYDPLVALDEEEGSVVLRFESLWHDFRVALPFGEAERYWFLNVDADFETKDTAAELAEKLGRQEATIVSAGVHGIVRGQELMRRWLAWRRETDEFKGQGTLNIARETLQGLHRLVTPDKPLPDSYIELRAGPTF